MIWVAEKGGYSVRSMTPFARRPRSNTIVCPNEVVANEYRVVSISDSPDHFPIDLRSAVPTPVMRTKRLREAGRGHGYEGWREWARRPFRIERIPGFEVERRLRLGRLSIAGKRRGRAHARFLSLSGGRRGSAVRYYGSGWW